MPSVSCVPATVNCDTEMCGPPFCHLRSAAKDAPTGETRSQEDNDELSRAPENKQQVLLRVSFEGLPSPGPDADEAIAQLLNIKYEELTKIFAHYCKLSDCKTPWTATHLKLGAQRAPLRRRAIISGTSHARSASFFPQVAVHHHSPPAPTHHHSITKRTAPLPNLTPHLSTVGMKRLVRDSGLERKVYNIDAITRLFNLTAGLKASLSPLVRLPRASTPLNTASPSVPSP